MTHWSDYSLRGWLSFLAFMHIGLALRSFLDPNFLFDKIFNYTKKEMALVHYFSINSLIHAFILIQSAIHLYVSPLQIITIFILIVFILLNIFEAFYYKTIDFYGGTLLPFSMSVISLIWLILFHYVWKQRYPMDANEEHMKCFMPQGINKSLINKRFKTKLSSNPPIHYYRIMNSDMNIHTMKSEKIHSE